MAAKTTTADGNWEDGGTWTGGAAPVAGDTVTLSHNVIITANVDIGSSPATGGTPAIQFASVTGKTLTVNAGVTLTCKGDFKFANSNTQSENKLVLSAGSTFTFLPPSAQQYKFDCAVNSHIICNGSSGSHVTVKTDKSSSGLACYTACSGYTVSGFHTCTYTDFIDLGDTSNLGVSALRARGGVNYPDANSHYSITDCTFTRCNFSLVAGGGSWDGNVTFQRNSFSSSVVATLGGFANMTGQIVFTIAGTSGTWLVDTNGFDYGIFFGTARARTQVSNNIATAFKFSAGSWSSSDKFSGNIITECVDQGFGGPVKNLYCYTTDTANPHWASIPADASVVDCVFDPPVGVDGAGDILFGSSANTACSATGNLVLSQSNKSAGKLVALGHSETGAFTVNHNTILGLTEAGLIHTDETTNGYAGMVASCRSNLIYASSAGSYVNAVAATGAGTIAVDEVTIADYNAFRNPSSGTCLYNTSTSQGSVVGYNGIKVSNANPYPNAQVGLHDLTITSDPFVDSTRNIAKWGAYKGTAETAAAAIAYAVANPAAATDANTGLWAWVRDGFKVTSTTLKDAGHDGVTIGAMEYAAASGGGAGMGSRRGHTLLRP